MVYKDRETQLQAQRNAYHARKDYFRNKQKDRKRILKEWFRELLSTLKCSRCPESDPCCFDFHHSDPSQKEEKISVMLHKIRTKEAILAEMAKCEVLCANCHRKHHNKERQENALTDQMLLK